jgi:hypothetical protein
MDQRFVSYQLEFPLGLELSTATRIFTSLGALFDPVGCLGRPSRRPTVVFEALSTPSSVNYLVSFPPTMATTIRQHLHGVVPALRITEAMASPRTWSRAIELHRPWQYIAEIDPRQTHVVLNCLRDLHVDEAVLIQTIMTAPSVLAAIDGGRRYWTVARLAVSAEGDRAGELLERVQGAYRTLGIVKARELPRRWLGRVAERAVPLHAWPDPLTPESLALTCLLPIDSPQVPGLPLGRGRRLAPEHHVPSDQRRIAISNAPGIERVLSLAPNDRMQHCYIVAPNGSGKSTLLQNLILDDIREGHGVLFIDFAGDSVTQILERVPRRRIDDVIVYDVSDPETTMGFNVLAGPNPRAVMADLATILDKLFDLSRHAPRAINVLKYVLLTLAMQGYTLCEVELALEPGARGAMFRKKLIRGLTDRELCGFWSRFEKLSTKDQAEMGAAIIHRLGSLLLYPELRTSLGQTKSGFDMAQVLTENKILLVPLNEGQLGEELCRLVSTLVLAKLWATVQARPIDGRPDFYCYIDEFQECLHTPVSLNRIFSKARKYRLGMTVAHQYPHQLSEELRREVFANARSKIVFQTTSAKDTQLLAAELGELIEARDIDNLGPYEVIARLVANGRVTEAATGWTFPPSQSVGLAAEIVKNSRTRYGRPIAQVEAELDARYDLSAAVPGRPTSQITEPEPPIGWEPWE